jgi:hypothetical protein
MRQTARWYPAAWQEHTPNVCRCARISTQGQQQYNGVPVVQYLMSNA